MGCSRRRRRRSSVPATDVNVSGATALSGHNTPVRLHGSDSLPHDRVGTLSRAAQPCDVDAPLIRPVRRRGAPRTWTVRSSRPLALSSTPTIPSMSLVANRRAGCARRGPHPRRLAGHAGRSMDASHAPLRLRGAAAPDAPDPRSRLRSSWYPCGPHSGDAGGPAGPDPAARHHHRSSCCCIATEAVMPRRRTWRVYWGHPPVVPRPRVGPGAEDSTAQAAGG